MDDILYEALVKYFTHLSNFGYKNYGEVYKLLYSIIITSMLQEDFKNIATEEDRRLIESSMQCILGSTCLLPYPSECR